MLAISSTVAKRCSSDVGRCCLTNCAAACSTDWPFCRARSATKVSTPSDIVGPGKTEFTVTPEPDVNSAPRLQLVERGNRGINLALAAAVHDDIRPRLRKPPGNGMADAGRGSGDQRSFSRKIDLHVVSPSLLTEISDARRYIAIGWP